MCNPSKSCRSSSVFKEEKESEVMTLPSFFCINVAFMAKSKKSIEIPNFLEISLNRQSNHSINFIFWVRNVIDC